MDYRLVSKGLLVVLVKGICNYFIFLFRKCREVLGRNGLHFYKEDNKSSCQNAEENGNLSCRCATWGAYRLSSTVTCQTYL